MQRNLFGLPEQCPVKHILGVDRVSLPSLPFDLRRWLPEVAAVYLVIADGELVYVGQTRCLRNRWKSHHLIKELRSRQNVRIAWFEVAPEHLFGVEQSLIVEAKPEFNSIMGRCHA